MCKKRDKIKNKGVREHLERKRNKGQNNILIIGVLVILLGVLIILASIILSAAYIPTIEESYILKLKIWTVIDDLLMCLGTTVITVGAGTALYSYFDFVNYMQDKMKRVMIDYEFTDILSENEKKKLATKLEKEIVHQVAGNNLYDFVQDEVLSLAKQAFYEKHILTISCEKVDQTIVKTIHRSYILNCSSQADFDIAGANMFTICHHNKDDINIAKDVTLNINGTIFSLEDYDKEEKPSNEEVYNKQCILSLKKEAIDRMQKSMDKENWDNLYKVESDMVSVVQENDLTFAYRLFYPCKSTMFLFTYNPDEFEVMENIFAFKDTDLSNMEDNPVKVIHNRGSILIEINNWVLPGDGVVFVLAPISSKRNHSVRV